MVQRLQALPGHGMLFLPPDQFVRRPLPQEPAGVRAIQLKICKLDMTFDLTVWVFPTIKMNQFTHQNGIGAFGNQIMNAVGIVCWVGQVRQVGRVGHDLNLTEDG